MTGIFVSEVAVKVDARFRRQKVKLSLSILLVGVLSRGAYRRECESRPKNTFTFVSREPPTVVPITRFSIDYRSRTPSIPSILDGLRLEKKKKKLRKNGIGSIFATKETNATRARIRICKIVRGNVLQFCED